MQHSAGSPGMIFFSLGQNLPRPLAPYGATKREVYQLPRFESAYRIEGNEDQVGLFIDSGQRQKHNSSYIKAGQKWSRLLFSAFLSVIVTLRSYQRVKTRR